jgi:hypothetical protein
MLLLRHLMELNFEHVLSINLLSNFANLSEVDSIFIYLYRSKFRTVFVSASEHGCPSEDKWRVVCGPELERQGSLIS